MNIIIISRQQHARYVPVLELSSRDGGGVLYVCLYVLLEMFDIFFFLYVFLGFGSGFELSSGMVLHVH